MTPTTILSTTAHVYGLSVDDLRGPSRSRRVAEARAVAAFVAYELTDASYRDLSAELGRGWSGVRFLIDGIASRLGRREARISRMVEDVERRLTGS